MACWGDPGEASVAFFSGSEGLFDISEIDFALEAPVARGGTVSLTVELETPGAARVTFGWAIAR